MSPVSQVGFSVRCSRKSFRGWEMRSEVPAAQPRKGEQTRRWNYHLIPELAIWLNRKYGAVGFKLTKAHSGHRCFNAYLRRSKKRDEGTCCYCVSPVDDIEHKLFICSTSGVGKKAVGQAVGAEPLLVVVLTGWSLSFSSLGGTGCSSSPILRLWKILPSFSS